MSSIAVLVIVVTLAAIVVGIVVLARQGHPENTATHDMPGGPSDAPAEGPTDAPYPPGSRPAGPGAESMAPEPDPRPSDQPDGPGQN